MIIVGVVEKGEIKLPPDVQLPEGAKVRVDVICPANTPPEESDKRPIGKKLLDFAGCVEGLPEDFSINHDHYLYGTPKQ